MDDKDLKSIRCPKCKSLMPPATTECRKCGLELSSFNLHDAPSEDDPHGLYSKLSCEERYKDSDYESDVSDKEEFATSSVENDDNSGVQADYVPSFFKEDGGKTVSNDRPVEAENKYSPDDSGVEGVVLKKRTSTENWRDFSTRPYETVLNYNQTAPRNDDYKPSPDSGIPIEEILNWIKVKPFKVCIFLFIAGIIVANLGAVAIILLPFLIIGLVLIVMPNDYKNRK